MFFKIWCKDTHFFAYMQIKIVKSRKKNGKSAKKSHARLCMSFFCSIFAPQNVRTAMNRIFCWIAMTLFSACALAGVHDLVWDYTVSAPTENPDRGLQYGSAVNDAEGVKNGLKGIKCLGGCGRGYLPSGRSDLRGGRSADTDGEPQCAR